LGRKAYLKIFLFLLPAILFTTIFFITPAVITTIMGFTNMDYRFQWNFVGLYNYFKMLIDPLVPKIILTTFVYTFGTLLIFNVTFGLILAILTTSIREKRGIFFRTIWLLPRFTPPVVYGVIWLWILSPMKEGLLNSFLGYDYMPWISNFPWQVIIITNGFIGASMGMIIFASAIKSISKDYLWAAKVDGASWLQEIGYIILPMIRWPVAFITAYQTLSLLTSYQYILLITEGGPYFKSTVWSLYSYKVAFSSYAGTYEFGYGAALATVLVIVGIIASIFYWRIFKFKEMMEEPKIDVV